MQNQTITFNLSIEATNTILKALGKMPYEEVYQLIDNLQQQAAQQLQPQTTTATSNNGS